MVEIARCIVCGLVHENGLLARMDHAEETRGANVRSRCGGEPRAGPADVISGSWLLEQVATRGRLL